jgi:hypothetical protein
MKRKNIFQGLVALFLIAIVTVNLSFGSSVKHLFRPKLARADDPIWCDCALLGGNKNCAVNNYGSSCAPIQEDINCSLYNGNCGG